MSNTNKEHSNSNQNHTIESTDPSSRRDTLTANTNSPDKTPSKSVIKAAANHSHESNIPRCILAGGPAFGWTHESVVVCWRRFLGILGDFNKTCSPSTLADVFNYLHEMTSALLKIRDYQSVQAIQNKVSVHPVPQYVPPIDFIAPVLFESWTLPDKFLDAKLTSIRILSDIVIRLHDGSQNMDLISQFYRLIHRIIVNSEEKCVYEVIRACNMRLFASFLPSSHLLIMDLLSAVNIILKNPTCGLDIPRSDSIILIINLICYPNHYGIIDVFDPTILEPKLMQCTDLKTQLIKLLTQSVLTDPSGEVRCLACTGLALYFVTEIMNQSHNSTKNNSTENDHNYLLDSIIILLGMMRFSDRVVAQIAVEMVLMLADYCPLILNYNPVLAPLILSSLTWTLYHTWDKLDFEKFSSIDKRYFITILQAILEWTMCLPMQTLFKSLNTLLNQTNNNSNNNYIILPSRANCSLLNLIINVLYFVMSETNIISIANSNQSANNSVSYVLADYFPDPLMRIVNQCEQLIDLNLFNAPKVKLDMSTLLIKSLLMTGSGYPLSGLQTTGDYISQALESIRLSARITICHFLNHLDQFPMTKHGAQLNTCIQEHHDQLDLFIKTKIDEQELEPEVFEQNNLQIFVLDQSLLITFLTLSPSLSTDSDQSKNLHNHSNQNDLKSVDSSNKFKVSDLYHIKNSCEQNDQKGSLITDRNYTRVIVRDLSGKYSWDASYLYGLPICDANIIPNDKSSSNELNVDSTIKSDSLTNRNPPPCPPPRMNPNPPPLLNNSAINVANPPDRLNGLLRELTSNSPECSITWGPTAPGDHGSKDLSEEEKMPCKNLEKMTTDQITSQCQLDAGIGSNKTSNFDLNLCYSKYVHENYPELASKKVLLKKLSSSDQNDYFSPFEISRHLLNQFGYLAWRNRSVIELLNKSTALVRELKHLDKLGSRETHKIAVFYIGSGQEDKQTILSTQTTSLEFENFVAGLGFEVDLRSHRGFCGGLERNGRVGLSTPYYVTSGVEVIFHVSTRMPSSTQEDFKFKHLGNDEVMIIWNENSRSFKRSALPTQFGDVLIIITPLLNGLHRVEVRRESQVAFFGPIVENAILTADVLPGLVRATAISANRAIRSMKPGYRHHYEDRAAILQQIVSRYALPCSFEDYTLSILMPGLTPDLSSSVGNQSSQSNQQLQFQQQSQQHLNIDTSNNIHKETKSFNQFNLNHFGGSIVNPSWNLNSSQTALSINRPSNAMARAQNN